MKPNEWLHFFSANTAHNHIYTMWNSRLYSCSSTKRFLTSFWKRPFYGYQFHLKVLYYCNARKSFSWFDCYKITAWIKSGTLCSILLRMGSFLSVLQMVHEIVAFFNLWFTFGYNELKFSLFSIALELKVFCSGKIFFWRMFLIDEHILPVK